MFLAIGSLQLILALYRLHSEGLSNIGITFLVLSGIMVVLALGMHPKLGLIPRVEISDRELKMKTSTFGKSLSLNWASIRQITFKSYRIHFLLNDGSRQTLRLPIISEISLDVKEGLREMSEHKGIEVLRA